MAYDHGGIEALKPRPSGGRKHENMALEEEKALLARFARARVFKSAGSAQRLLSVHVTIYNFNVQRHLISARTHRAFRASAMQTWHEVVPCRSQGAEVPPHSRIFVLMEPWLASFPIAGSRAWQHPQKLRKQHHSRSQSLPFPSRDSSSRS
jgi:hypothetical protein